MKKISNLIFAVIAGLMTPCADAWEPSPDRSTKKTANVTTSAPGVALPQALPWDLKVLKRTPSMRWLSQDGPIHSLIYGGLPHKGNPTEVFAFYASPKTLGIKTASDKVPGIVLIHGGGGTAFAEWAWLWAQRGYAAIAMDLSGSRPIAPVFDSNGRPVPNQASQPQTRTRLPYGGPDQGASEKFESIGGDFSDDWPYHAVANVIRAHSLLRSLPEVDADRTAVTGISWGGYTTCIVASLDNRFRAAVPVYGCGYLFEGESVQKKSIDQLGPNRDAWIKTYDPSAYLTRCEVPIFFVNGTNDIHYPLDSYMKTYHGVLARRQLRIEVNMRHSHPAGWAPKEIGRFIDSHCRNGVPLPQVDEPGPHTYGVQLSFVSTVPIESASLHYTTDNGLRSERAWKSIPAMVSSGSVIASSPPADANTWFIELVDAEGVSVTSEVQFANVQ